MISHHQSTPETLVLTTRAAEQEAAGDLAAAETLYLQILSAQPDNVAALYALGRVSFNGGKRAHAKKAWGRITEIMPEFADAWLALARVHDAEGALGQAADCLGRLLKVSPAHAEALLEMAKYLMRAARSGEALQCVYVLLRAEPGNQEGHALKRQLLAAFSSNYAWAIKAIAARRHLSLGTIFELGSRDANDAIWLGRLFPRADVYAFEANPAAAAACKDNVAFSSLRNVHVVDRAVADFDGPTSFYAFDTLKYDNIGASSLFEIDFTTLRSPRDADYGRENPQIKIDVAATRLDTFCAANQVTGIDLLCMDLQGAELRALKGLGDRLRKVPYVVAEVAYRPTYQGACTFGDVDGYLQTYGFSALSQVPPDTGYFFEFNVLWENAAAAGA